MIGVASLGHGHPELAEAIAEQAHRLVSCFGSFANDRRADLYRELARHLPDAERFFLCNSGTEAIEAAMKIAAAATGRARFLHLEGSFHGRTLGALALGSRAGHRGPLEALLPETGRLRPGDPGSLELIDDRTAAVVVEVIQGEGGVRPIDADWLRAVEAGCRRQGAMLIVDEVQTGGGRTGAWFAHQDIGLRPDLLCLAKGLGGGLPVGAVGMRRGVPALALVGVEQPVECLEGHAVRRVEVV